MTSDVSDNADDLDRYDGNYCWGSDYVWLASDEQGQVAAFITADAGPIPLKIYRQLPGADDPDAEVLGDIGIEDMVLAGLAPSTAADLFIQVPDPSSFIALAERGLFVYDWTDIHKRIVEKTGKYQLVAAPRQPILVDALSSTLIEAAALQSFGIEAFGETYLEIVPPFVPRKASFP